MMRGYKKALLVILLLSCFLVLMVGCGSSSNAPAAKPDEKKPAEQVATDDKYPSRPIELICAYGPGGGSDVFSRSIAIPLGKILGQSVVVKNVSGSAGGVGTVYVAKQPADGYTILQNVTDMIINDTMKRVEVTHEDFIPLGRVQHDQSLFWVSTESKFKTMKEVIEYAKKNPGKLKMAISQSAGFDETMTSTFKKVAGIDITLVPYNAGGEAVAALLGGHVDLLHEEAGSAIALYQGKKIKPLLVMTEERLPVFPDVPTAKELGYDVTMGIWRGLFVRKGTPPEIVAKLEAAIQKSTEDSVYKAVTKEIMLDQRPGYLNSEQFSQFLSKEYDTYYSVLKGLGYIKE